MLYPLKLNPLFKERIWGGRRLAQIFAYDLPQQSLIGEVWAVADHPHGVTHISNGFLAGKSLTEVFQQYTVQLVGYPLPGRFPLLVKLLAATLDLSVQVHPNDFYAGLQEKDSGKTELWYIIDADPGSKIVYGLNPGITKQDLKELSPDNFKNCFNQVSVKPGDAFYIQPGLVHSLGAGILAAEVQQNSDITYRIYDYDRKDCHGNKRPLHLAKALDVVDLSLHPYAVDLTVEFSCPKFTVDLVNVVYRQTHRLQGMEIHLVLRGTGRLADLSVKAGDAVILPACLSEVGFEGSFITLRCRL